ncbi:MAG: sensor histidine kinase [Actinomycetota bacterium]|nr:sensor histidine kinase [Actinomycetota bacterium]
MLEQVGRRLWGIFRRLIASYVLVTVVVVVLVEAFVLGYQVPRMVSDTQLHTQVQETAASYWGQLVQRYPSGVPTGALLGETGQRPEPGTAQTAPDASTLIVPAVAGTVNSDKALTAVVAIGQDGTIVASSAPSRYPPGQPAARYLPGGASAAIHAGLLKGVGGGIGSTPYGSVAWTLYGGRNPVKSSASGPGGTYLYVQAPHSTGLVNPIRAWDELGQVSGNSLLSTILYVLLLVIVPVGVLFGVLASRRVVRRVRRLERATVAVADGDYTVALPTSGRDEVGRLEANVATMAHQLNSALAAERERVTSEARAAERSRIAREIHDAISQHLFGLRMIASGMRRADPQNEQVQAIERITEEALRDMQMLLLELRPAGLDGAGLGPALEQICAAYHDRLGVTVDADLADITLPEPVEDALLRVTQEACTNAIRHGNAHRLAVSMTRQNGQVELAVRDNGTGFDPAALHTGSGLRHIHDRVTELGGTVDIDSAPGAGAAVTVRVPAP